MNLCIPYVSDRNENTSLSLFLWNEEFPDCEWARVCVCVCVCMLSIWNMFECHGKNDASIKGFNVVQHMTYI